jgi:hypothetical protein
MTYWHGKAWQGRYDADKKIVSIHPPEGSVLHDETIPDELIYDLDDAWESFADNYLCDNDLDLTDEE